VLQNYRASVDFTGENRMYVGKPTKNLEFYHFNADTMGLGTVRRPFNTHGHSSSSHQTSWAQAKPHPESEVWKIYDSIPDGYSR